MVQVPATTIEAAPDTSQAVVAAEPPVPNGPLISDCVEYIPAGAFAGDPRAVDLWNFIGQDTTQLTQLCTELDQSEPATLQTFSAALAAQRASSPPATDVVTTEPPASLPVAPFVPATISPAATIAPVTTPATEPASPGLDPRFATCKAAKQAGYGPYVQGSDPEYDWYRDADHDGIVCE